MENVKFVEEHELWSDIFNFENPDLKEPVNLPSGFDEKDRSNLAEISHNFDFVPIHDMGWHFYCYTTVRLSRVAAISLRTHFSSTHPTFSWDRFFLHDSLVPVIQLSTENALLRFARLCKKNGINLPSDCIPKRSPQNEMYTLLIADDFVHFYSSMKPDMERMKDLYQIGFDFPNLKIVNSENLLPLVFSVLDDVLFNNRSFNRFHNRENFFSIIAEMDYYSLKFKSIDPPYPTYRFNCKDVLNLIRCLDCAIHQLEGDKFGYFVNLLKQFDISNEELIKYIFCAKFLKEKCTGDMELKSINWDDTIRLIRDFN